VCRCSSLTVAAQLVKGGRGVSLLPRLLVQNWIDEGLICAMETDLPMHPSGMFGAYRFAEGSSFLQEIIGLGHNVMLETKLIEKLSTSRPAISTAGPPSLGRVPVRAALNRT
jgi:hypothetical protein